MFTFGAATGLFSNWSARADQEDARNVAIDQATIAALNLYAPEMVPLYVADDLPETFERLLDRAMATANATASAVQDDASYVETYRNALGVLLAEQKLIF